MTDRQLHHSRMGTVIRMCQRDVLANGLDGKKTSGWLPDSWDGHPPAHQPLTAPRPQDCEKGGVTLLEPGGGLTQTSFAGLQTDGSISLSHLGEPGHLATSATLAAYAGVNEGNNAAPVVRRREAVSYTTDLVIKYTCGGKIGSSLDHVPILGIPEGEENKQHNASGIQTMTWMTTRQAPSTHNYVAARRSRPRTSNPWLWLSQVGSRVK